MKLISHEGDKDEPTPEVVEQKPLNRGIYRTALTLIALYASGVGLVVTLYALAGGPYPLVLAGILSPPIPYQLARLARLARKGYNPYLD
jgi:hypothetical protein